MLRLLKVLFSLALVLGIESRLHAFSLLGPYEEWQDHRIGYQLPGDIGGPHNVGEEFRWTIPVITYGFDESFINYFGTNGVTAIEQAMQVLNDLPRFSEVTPEMISENGPYPQYVIMQNPQAAALQLADVKSVALHFMMEELGLADPEQYVFTLRSRTTFSNPDSTNWVVIQRNFDPVTFDPTNQINDIIYTYDRILKLKDSAGDYDIPNVIPVTANPNKGTVASGRLGLRLGAFYPGTNSFTALTRDDIGGLRYLYRAQNLNVERLLPNIDEVFTNTTNPQILTNYDLGLLIENSQQTTNTPADLQALFPGLAIASTNSYLTNLIVTNVTSYFTNFPYPLGVPLEQVYITNFTTNIVQLFDYEFSNIVTNDYSTSRWVTDRTYEIVPSPVYTPGGSALQTNIISENTYLTNEVGGSFYIRPTNFIDMVFLTNTVQQLGQTTNVIQSFFSANVAVTNITPPPIALTTLDYAAFVKNTRNTTNDPAQVLALYTNAFITSTNAHLGPLITTNIITYFINYPWAPRQIYETNYTTNVVVLYDYTFGNAVVDPYFTERPVFVQTLETVPASDYIPGINNSVRTNLIESHFDTEVIDNGEIFLVPTNLIGYAYVSNVLTSVTNTTNYDFFAVADILLHTNTTQLDLLLTSDLATFTEQARTNDPQALLALYPDILIVSSNRYFTNVVSSNLVNIFTNFPWSPAGLLTITQQVTYATNVATNWNYIFGNVVTNFGSTLPVPTNGTMIVEEMVIAAPPYSPGGSPEVTNYTTTSVITNFPVGSIYIVPTNLFGYQILSTQLVDVVAVSNSIVFTNFSATGIEQTNVTTYIRYETNYWLNAYPIEFLSTNDIGTNFFGFYRETIAWVTNTTYEVYPIELLSTNDLATNIFGTHREIVSYFTNTLVPFYSVESRTPAIDVGLRAGLDKLNFVRVNYDSLTGTNQLNVTNSYIDTVILSNTVVQQTLRRVVTQPDILFSAGDLGTQSGRPVAVRRSSADPNWNPFNFNAINGSQDLAGPGAIPPQVNIIFSKVGPYFDNDEAGGRFTQDTAPLFRWASYDSSTNLIIYPVGTSIQQIEQIVTTP